MLDVKLATSHRAGISQFCSISTAHWQAICSDVSGAMYWYCDVSRQGWLVVHAFCAPGQSLGQDARGCNPCPEGSFRPASAAQTACYLCPAGTAQSTPGSLRVQCRLERVVHCLVGAQNEPSGSGNWCPPMSGAEIKRAATRLGKLYGVLAWVLRASPWYALSIADFHSQLLSGTTDTCTCRYQGCQRAAVALPVITLHCSL